MQESLSSPQSSTQDDNEPSCTEAQQGMIQRLTARCQPVPAKVFFQGTSWKKKNTKNNHNKYKCIRPFECKVTVFEQEDRLTQGLLFKAISGLSFDNTKTKISSLNKMLYRCKKFIVQV